ncbi:recombinase RecF [Hafnia paralvei]|uniref:AAA family ATPase n=1 Tax=Hafnia paralvei TaxID=546367 RepID=UPI000DF2559B|nr:AAA family ATPase [Hafnia paralvei]RDA70451.1 recombinase RecF [Hafnia paralvei]RDA71353.1 recombinase RecF [Hafnia paralvei]RDA72471.1 recombinase RecF [Hafnia paralvei]RDA80559.1 recombinase RecF [Hafnia paralvei]RDA80944.1 recombinase RecF [Hafnia paralvei]
MKIKNIKITSIGGISSLHLNALNEQVNIICGENGVGKTNILDSIAFCFSELDSNIVSKKSGSDSGTIEIKTTQNDLPENFKFEINVFAPSDSDRYISNSLYQERKQYLLYLKTNRGIDYRKIESIKSDPDITYRARHNTSGVKNEDIKEWLLNRVLHSAHKNHLSETQLKNLELSKKCFSVLNSDYAYSHLDTKNEIFLKTPTGEIYLEYLSSGFKSVIFILLGLIKEIDYRFEANRIPAEEYEGIILIDEIELHLHPEWQGRICTILKNIFPMAQFFITTHSPHVVQTAGQGEVIALERHADGHINQRPLPASEYGYQGWTVEEILEDIMGMPDLRTKKYNEIKKKFDDALDREDKLGAQNAYQDLDEILHPQYPLRPVFKMQLDKILGGER